MNNANVITIAVNPKEYFEVFRNKNFNKKHKGIKKTTQGMNFESYASRIMDLREYDSVDRAPKKRIQKRFQKIILFGCYNLSSIWSFLISRFKTTEKRT